MHQWCQWYQGCSSMQGILDAVFNSAIIFQWISNMIWSSDVTDTWCIPRDVIPAHLPCIAVCACIDHRVDPCIDADHWFTIMSWSYSDKWTTLSWCDPLLTTPSWILPPSAIMPDSCSPPTSCISSLEAWPSCEYQSTSDALDIIIYYQVRFSGFRAFANFCLPTHIMTNDCTLRVVVGAPVY